MNRLPKMRLVDDGDVRIKGSVAQILRGPNRLPIRFA